MIAQAGATLAIRVALPLHKPERPSSVAIRLMCPNVLVFNLLNPTVELWGLFVRSASDKVAVCRLVLTTSNGVVKAAAIDPALAPEMNDCRATMLGGTCRPLSS